LFHVIRNKAISETELAELAVSQLRERLPATWDVAVAEPSPMRRARPDVCLDITSLDGMRATIVVEVIGPRTAPYLRDVLERLRRVREAMPDAALLAVAPYFSPRIRAELARNGIGYADATGNFRLTLDQPALFIEMSGADRDPWPDDQPLKSLRGAAAGRAVRAFCDFAPPYGIRELASRADVPAPTLSRVAELLEREGILERERPRGRIIALDWQETLRRWTQDYNFTRSNTTSTWLEPRGLRAFEDKLRTLAHNSAITGSLAANAIAPIAAPRLAAVYVEDVRATAAQLGLRPAESGANVLLAEPFDEVVFARDFDQEGLSYAAYSQVAVDLLTGPGRWPAEGEAVLEWMQENEPTWRN
jgi:hypothetical protein